MMFLPLSATVVLAQDDGDDAAGCPNQVCTVNAAGNCYVCNGGANQGCSPKVGDCTQCTNWICKPPKVTHRFPPGSELAEAWQKACGAAFQYRATTNGQAGATKHGTAITLSLAQMDKPAYLVSATFGLKDLFLRGVMTNQSPQTIVAYRLGWVYLFPDRAEIQLGEWMNIPAGIKPGEVHNVPGQGASPDPIRLGAKRVEFFVAEVKYANGGSWKEDLSKIKLMKLPNGTAAVSQRGVRL
jgi:hypothetical protein